MKTFRNIFCIAMAIVLLAVSFTACGKKDETSNTDVDKATNNSSSSNETSDNTTTDKLVSEDGDEFIVDIITKGEIEENAEGINSNKFTVAGTSFTLPCNTSNLFDAGWTIKSNMTFDNFFEGKTETSLVSFEIDSPDNDAEISLSSIYNDSEENKPLEECQLTGVKMDPYYFENADFVLPGGITKNSTAADVLSVFGNPNDNSNFEYGYNLDDQLTYENHNNTSLTYSFTFNDDGTLYSVRIEYEMQ